MSGSEFDRFSGEYEELLRDPIRERFSHSGTDFFHRRKRDLIRAFWRGRQADTKKLRYLDLGCGKGELLDLLKGDFEAVAGCDPSIGMMEGIQGVETRVQSNPFVIPFDDGTFDFVTAVCVYHHVPVSERGSLTAEAKRVLKPHGVFCVIEHNPYNPVTRLIVSRTTVDAGAILLSPGEAKGLIKSTGLSILRRQFFMYFPEKLYDRIGALEGMLAAVPIGGQYAVFGQRNAVV